MRLPDARQVTVVRIAIGLMSVAAPGVAVRAAGVPRADSNRSVRTFAALFGVREIAIGAATLAALDAGVEHRTVCFANAAVDGADAVAMVRSIRRDGPSRLTAVPLPLTLATVANWIRLAMVGG
ncbi:MAG: hypothetical protein JWO37_373 [Acidimicrobiales bacterium]|jgi:hypothetical protein|nr:hypothetical protein [Acidimicrobiales bacterium]